MPCNLCKKSFVFNQEYMKKKLISALILGAGKTNNINNIEKITKNINSLFWQKNSFLNNGIANINFIGGYKFNIIDKTDNDINFIYNKNWRKNILESLKKFHFKNETIINYSDTLHDFNTIKKIYDSRAKLTICVDSNWLSRYKYRNWKDKKNSERYCPKDKIFFKNSNNFQNKKEFAGLIKISTEIIPIFNHIIYDKKIKNFPELLNSLIKIEKSVRFIDVKGNWCEFNSTEDKKNFFLKSKHETVFRVSKSIPEIKFLNQISINKNDWMLNKKDILEEITLKFKKKVIVRSSSLLEDKDSASNAGKYLSIGNILSKDIKSIKSCIDKVFKSYNVVNPLDVVFIQDFIENVDISGVLFTRTLDTNLPYYVCNYDDETGLTDTITSGSIKKTKTFYSLKNKIDFVEDKKLKKLLLVANKIEQLTSQENLDIEFAIKKDHIFIFQARFLFIKKKMMTDKSYYRLAEKNHKNLINYFKKVKTISKHSAILSNMSDWNPAEILGLKPNNLATSLYKELITNKVWHIQRKNIGNFSINQPLMININGRNFINSTYSMMSFLPKKIGAPLRKRIIDHSINNLKNKNFLHDKIEFKIIKTCYDLNFDNDIKEKYSFLTNNEIKFLKNEFIKTTINSFKIETNATSKLNNLDNQWNKIKKMKIGNLQKITKIIPILKKYGTLTFANSARAGFISISILKSLIQKKIINKKEFNNFMFSVNTISKEYLNDLYLLKNMQIEKKKFINKYGHLRPGTYNINSEKYADLNLEEIIRNSKIKKKKLEYYNFSKSIILKIQKIFKKDKFDYDATNIVSLLKIGIKNREYTKFIFSKVLSEVLDLLKEYSLKNKFKLNEFCNLELKTILNENNKYKLRKKINIQNKLNYFNNVLLLPEVIVEPNNIYNFTIFETKGNFVTEIKINSKIYYLENNINDAKLNNKIIIIESADPGYDWIFGHKIKGLITKYGGANSHMTIRCAELNIPAAIGVGEDIFNNIKKSVRITLDCKNQIITYD